MNVTVVWATPAVQDVVSVDLPAGATVADAVARSGFVAQHRIDVAAIGYAIFGRRTTADTLLADGDRVELSRPLVADPKAARARRARDGPPAKAPTAQHAPGGRLKTPIARGRRIADNAPMRVSVLFRRQLPVALFAAGVVIVAPVAAAQDRVDRSFREAATATVIDAATDALASAQDLTSVALDLIGIRYKWGGSTPATGLDCSGLVRYVFQQVTGVTLPRNARDMSRLGERVAAADLQPGDLVFFNTRRFAFSHVGIYLGDNRFVHAPRRGREVEVAALDSTFWQQRFDGARRMIGVLPGLIPSIVGEAVAAPPTASEVAVDGH